MQSRLQFPESCLASTALEEQSSCQTIPGISVACARLPSALRQEELLCCSVDFEVRGFELLQLYTVVAGKRRLTAVPVHNLLMA
jgi:hypothetical protein